MKKPVILGLHLLYWTGYILLLFFFYVLLKMGAPPNHGPGSARIFMQMAIGFGLVPGFAGFYLFYGFLFPRYLYRRKIVRLCIYGLLSAMLAGILGEITLSIMMRHIVPNESYIFPNYEPSEIGIALFLTTFVGMINGIIGLVTRGFVTSYGDIKLKEDLNRKNYEMELSLVKLQLNPHFLFNTINNIDVLIMKDAEKASSYLNKLSDIMRFMLYETKTEQIMLERELEYIRKYIDLQRIRTSNANFVKYEEEGNPGSWMIEPMLFIPFIENAFKHSENKKLVNAIRIKFSVTPQQIVFVCENNRAANALEKEKHGGLGNDLIRKRLSLLYPQRHELSVTDHNNTYRVQLTIGK